MVDVEEPHDVEQWTERSAVDDVVDSEASMENEAGAARLSVNLEMEHGSADIGGRHGGERIGHAAFGLVPVSLTRQCEQGSPG
jgi:hypothetical protein